LGGPTGGTDLNIYTNVLIPMFEKEYPGIRVDVTFGSNNASATTTAVQDRILASLQAHQPSPYDLVDVTPIYTTLWDLNDGVRLTTKNIPRLKEVRPAWLREAKDQALPFRASWVVLAYNSQEVPHPPTTLSALIQWIKAHPGKFTYAAPPTSGNGQSFALTVVNQYVPQRYENTFIYGYQPSLEKYWAKGFAELKTLGAKMYRGGYYPSGDQSVDQLLSSGAIWMTTQWSDIATASLHDGALPPYVKLAEITPLFNGGPADIMIPKNSAHIAAAEKFLNFLLSPSAQKAIVRVMGGFPGVMPRYMPKSVAQEFQAIDKKVPTDWYSSKYLEDFNAEWQKTVPVP
jgi:putative spermidine/putrescine transport system substrate-binding protein